MVTYGKYDANLPVFKDCVKRPIIVGAVQINEPFRADSMEGNYAQGKSGDYLMKGIEGELYICYKEIFEKTYDFLENV
jgi:hypothetical protein